MERRAGYALCAVALGAAAYTALQSFLPGGARPRYGRSFRGNPSFERLLFGWIGVALGRFTVGAEPRRVPRGGQTTARRETGAKEEKADRILRQIGKVLQTHLTDSESFSERLDGANERLSQQQSAGPVKDIVTALIDDNRDMRDKLYDVRSQLEDCAFRSCSCKRISSGPRKPGCATL